MVDKDRYITRKLPHGMTYDDVLHQLDEVYDSVERVGKVTPDMKTALRYVATVIVDEKIKDFHSRIGQR